MLYRVKDSDLQCNITGFGSGGGTTHYYLIHGNGSQVFGSSSTTYNVPRLGRSMASAKAHETAVAHQSIHANLQ